MLCQLSSRTTLLVLVLPVTILAQHDFDKAVLRVYEQKPFLSKTNKHQPRKKYGAGYTEQDITATLDRTVAASFVVRVSLLYYAQHKNAPIGRITPYFLSRLKQNLYFARDASNIIIQTIIIKVLIKAYTLLNR